MSAKKILYTATTNIHLLNFHLPYLKWFKDQGYEVHIACNGDPDIPFADKVWTVPFGRMPFDKNNKVAYKQLKSIIKDNNYSLIHCHTPMGGIITRLAARSARKKGTKVIYTAHGFHFYKGASFKNWALYYPIEWLFSSFTDAIITINNEDFDVIRNKKFLSSGKYKTDGIGINPDRLNIEQYNDKKSLREQLGYKEDDFLILYIAEFIPRKNHQFIFNAIPQVIKQVPKAKFLFAGGKAALGDKMIALANEKGFADNIDVLGYQKEIGKFIAIADVGISSSHAEGLPIGIAEIMSTGLPVIISNIRGHNELVVHGESGYLFDKNKQEEFVDSLVKLYKDSQLRKEMGQEGSRYMQKFLIENPLQQTVDIYKKILNI
ncbi:glycosyltransferase family 4 protein [Flavobacterium sp. LaA7.5]|nr:glycosyltransferase family 4 protein [Flavobacterium salilacus subsp. altitudinum]